MVVNFEKISIAHEGEQPFTTEVMGVHGERF
jgi:hypothetical protein